MAMIISLYGYTDAGIGAYGEMDRVVDEYGFPGLFFYLLGVTDYFSYNIEANRT